MSDASCNTPVAITHEAATPLPVADDLMLPEPVHYSASGLMALGRTMADALIHFTTT